MSVGTKGLALLSSAYLLAHPIRSKIVQLLRREGKSYGSKIAHELGIDESLAAFHLSMLAEHKFIEGDYGLANPPKGIPKAVKYYRLTAKVDEVLSDYQKAMTES